MLPLFNILYLETTRKCNLNCTYCSTGSNGLKDQGEDLPFDTIVNRILKPAYDLGTRFLDFSGGEFLMRPDAFDLLEYANKTGFVLGIASNGCYINDENLIRIKKITGNNILISIGVNSFTSDNFETRDATIDFILGKIKLLEKYSIRTNISITLGQFNKNTFEDTVKKTRELGVPFNRIPFVPRSCNSNEMMLDKESVKNYFHPILRKYFNGQISYTPYFLDPEIYFNISGQRKETHKVPTNPPVGCWVGAYYAINPEGDVSPCPMFLDHVTGGNAVTEDLNKILFESEVFTKIIQRDKLEGKCGNCKYNFTCGGCRVLAFYRTGNVYAEDPICFIDELSEKEIKQMEKETETSFKNYVRMAKFGKIYSK
mgnify:CR=1 FL=1